MTRRIAIQMDPLSKINFLTDTSMLLAEEAIRRGYAVFHYTPEMLSSAQGKAVTNGSVLHFDAAKNPAFSLGEPQMLILEEMDAVLLRQDPPFNMQYITTTYLLEKLPARTLVLNNPAAVRNHPEKLFPLEFPEFIPPTLISADKAAIRAFHAEHHDIVLKPLYGHGGRNVFHIEDAGENLNALLDVLLPAMAEPIIAQKFLPEVKMAERRMIVINGEVKGVLGRIPPAGEIRANLALGGKAISVDATARQRHIGESVGAVLKRSGLLLAGLDFIGDFLIEINLTSPTGLRQANALYGIHLERDFWDAVDCRWAENGV